MSFHRIHAMIMRHVYNYIHSWDKLVDSFYWPAMDIIIWGLTSAWIMKQVEIPNLVAILLTGLVFWQFVWRSQYEFTVNILEEMWNQNLVSLFSSPLTIMEWIISSIILGICKMFLSVGFAFILVYFIYHVTLWSGGWSLIPAGALLLANGWWIGLMVAGLIMRYGMRIQTLAWSGVYLLAPVSAIYYPLESLPLIAQQIAYWVPMSYVFTFMRQILSQGHADLHQLLFPSLLTIIYILISIYWFHQSVSASKVIGLSRLE